MRVALLLILSLSGGLATAETSDGLFESLAAAKERWEQQRLTDYQFEVFDACFCVLLPQMRRVRVVVHHGKTRSLELVGEGWDKSNSAGLVAGLVPMTIPNWFLFIEWRIRSQPPGNLSIEYDPLDGHPVHFKEDDPAIKYVQMELRIEKFKRR